MFGIGTGELLLILVIALLVLGPERMPKVARDVGRVVGELRRTSDELREEFLNADRTITKALDVAEQPATSAQPPAAATEASAPPDETPFDREMREARERLKAQQER
jgi:sec-independent protein translocase protein TatB